MKLVLSTAAALCLLPATAAFAQDAPAPAQASTPAVPAAAPAAPAAAAKFNLDTPIGELMADPEARKVMDANMPGLEQHPSYEMAKAMSLRQVQPYAGGAITDEALAKIETELAAIK